MFKYPLFFLGLVALYSFSGCSEKPHEKHWRFFLSSPSGKEVTNGLMKTNSSSGGPALSMVCYDEDIEVSQALFLDLVVSGGITFDGDYFQLTGAFEGDAFSGTLTNEEDTFLLTAKRLPDATYPDHSGISWLLKDEDLQDYEKDLDHAGLINGFDREVYLQGRQVYNDHCIQCHGDPQNEGSIPLSRKFWEEPMKTGDDPYTLYQVLTRGHGAMPPQVHLSPREKYSAVLYVLEKFISKKDDGPRYAYSSGYLDQLPKGSGLGPEIKPYHPWSDMDYGDFLINTYELVDSLTGPPRYHSPRPVPYADEDYTKANFAYKGIAVRLDKGEGGVSTGNTWMMFDHDVMRMAGGWTGDGFIDWDGILLNDKHETYPRTIGKLHYETSTGPGWANPATGKYDDPRFTARDDRQFGPLPKKWADYKGLYHYEDKVILSYSVGKAEVLELPGMEQLNGQTVFTRTMNISPSPVSLQMRVARSGAVAALKGDGATLSENEGHITLDIPKNTPLKITLLVAAKGTEDLNGFAQGLPEAEDLTKYINGGKTHYPQELKAEVIRGTNEGPIAVDWLNPPFDNPWKSRMKLSGIDFFKDPDKAAVCTVDGDVWVISGLLENGSSLTWRRIASGMFQPLGIKILDEQIFVTCRDQIVRLNDLNGDGETDFYESFNHDHQVTDHFHEFAMGLQADAEGNLYYAKSGRHAREALVPQHGTLLKVSKDGSETTLLARGFRAANGVCLNPDGTFIVTDQQGYWNPMNRINWVEPTGKFYGNMWGYGPPADTSRAAMEPPMMWVDMDFDRSPSELLWVESEKWGPLNGSLLSFSYGYGTVQLVLHEKVGDVRQGGVIDLPGVKFMTGVMRARFNPGDGQLYACGMSAWATNQMMKGGGLYRLRYTGNPLPLPISMNAREDGVELGFSVRLDPEHAMTVENYEVRAWDLKRSSRYGSKRYNTRELPVTGTSPIGNGKSILLNIEGLAPVDVMTIRYQLKDAEGNVMEGTVQSTVHRLSGESGKGD